MAFCSACGGQIPDGATVCPACNRPVAPAAGKTQAAGGELTDNVAGMLAYITIIPAIIFLLMEPYNRNRFIRFHSFQSLFLWVASFVAWIALVFISKVLGVIPLLGHLLAFLLWMALVFGLIIIWIILLIKASQGLMYQLPVIGDLAEQQANA